MLTVCSFGRTVLVLTCIAVTLFGGSMPASARALSILAFGDSLTAGYGVGPGKDYPTLLESMLREDGYDAVVHNAGVSGDTTGGGRSRLAWVLAGLSSPPDMAIVELGANDGLRFMDTNQTEANLDAILTAFAGHGIPVLFTGMRMPPNYGREYSDAFQAVFERLAQKHAVTFYPFFLDGVAGNPDLNQPDGIHPNAEGTAIIARNIHAVVRVMVGTLP